MQVTSGGDVSSGVFIAESRRPNLAEGHVGHAMSIPELRLSCQEV